MGTIMKGWFKKSVTSALAVVAMWLAMSAINTRPSSGQPVQSLDAEARAIALRIWEKGFTKCGDSYYSYDYGVYIDSRGRLIRETTNGLEEFPGNKLGVVQYRDVSFSHVAAKPDRLSSADRLNGVQWKGQVMEPTFSVSRHCERLDGKWQPWGEWNNIKQSGIGPAVPLSKKNNRWFVDREFEESFGTGEVEARRHDPIDQWLSKAQPPCAALPRN
jgi:hypothetical protein